MKKLVFFILIAAAAGAAVSCSSSKTVARSAAEEITARQVDAMLQKRVYKVDFTRAFPTAGPSFALSYPYYISVIGDRVESFLPYFGRAYSIPYGGGEGLNFDAPITDYSVKQGKKGNQRISFSARTSQDSYTFNLDIYPTGEASLTVTSVQKQSISFSGRIDLDAEFEAVRIDY